MHIFFCFHSTEVGTNPEGIMHQHVRGSAGKGLAGAAKFDGDDIFCPPCGQQVADSSRLCSVSQPASGSQDANV
jgi:hypothetical protein